MQERRTPAEFHRLQEAFLLEVLHRSQTAMRRVLELGCGFGRITRLLAQAWPDAEVTALDLSQEQLANARRYCGDNPRLHFQQFDFYSGAPFPGSDYDTVVAIEVFLHHPPRVVAGLLKKLAAVGRHIVNIDWSEAWPWPTPEHVWVHDYAALFAEAGLQCAVFPLPQKIDGKQQKLFVAARELSPQLAECAREINERIQPAVRSEAPPADEWSERLSRAIAELRDTIAPESPFILVDDAQWGGVTELNHSRVLPFLEKDGLYWGPPADDTAAWRELERLRLAGAGYIAFAWQSFWWLQHYGQFHRQIRAQFQCVLENQRLVVFKLRD